MSANEVGTGAASAASGLMVKNVPPITVVGLQVAGVSLDDWIKIATLLWLAIQAGWFVWSNIVKPKMQAKRQAKRTTSRSRVFRDGDK